MPVLPYFAGYVLAFALPLGLLWGGAWLAAPALVVWVFVPLADHFGGEETRWGDEAPKSQWRYRWLARAWTPVQLALYVWGFMVAADAELSFAHRAMAVFNLGVLGGATGITFAHEMMHRSDRIDRFCAELLMTVVTYPWFCVEHVHGHHKRVATPDDPATARYGEVLYTFLWRSYFGGLKSAVAFERKQQRKRKQTLWHPSSRVWRYLATLTALYGTVSFVWGVAGLLALLGLSVVAIGMLEGINYLEHYGLVRKQVIGPSGTLRYERVMPHHSWNSSHRVSNFMLLNLARHSDHHAHAARSWERLRHFEDAPQLPSGYGAMFLLAFVPPLWFYVMNPRVLQWRQQHGVELPSASAPSRLATA